jgi:hypothetical protein
MGKKGLKNSLLPSFSAFSLSFSFYYNILYITQLTPQKYAIMKEPLSEDLGRPIPENKNVVAEEVTAMMSRARKV